MKNKSMWWVLAALGVILCAAMLLMGKNKEQQLPEETYTTEQIHFDGVDTWEEYQALSPEDQEAFYQQFGSAEAFEAWIVSVKPEATLPDFIWNIDGKQPDAYTWEEYLALSLEKQEAFFLWFETEADFEAWIESVKPAETTVSVMQWNKTGKQPNQYTWEEYQALSQEEQEAFFLWFERETDFEAWMASVKPADTSAPVMQWDKAEKQPNQYTWEEYQALSPEEQEAFYHWFDTKKAFESWMKTAKPAETTEPVLNWDRPGKSPSEYTWEEYEALSPEEQEAFYLWFGTKTAFETWMNGAKTPESEPAGLTWSKPGKQPDAYTWEEYEALSPEEQEGFFRWFGSVEAFEAWLDAAKPKSPEFGTASWNKSGKQPNEYTWEEYQALSPEDQEAFYQWFGSVEDFETWMNMAMEE